jgi:SAM-dependent methyltransferase
MLVRDVYLWLCHRLYNEFAWSYDVVAWLVSAGHWAEWRRQALAFLPARGPVLEVGFGTGELLGELADREPPVYGLEPSPAMQAIAGAKLRRRGVADRVPRLRGLAQQLPFPDGYLAAIVATFPAEYIFDPCTAREFARVLRPAPPTMLHRLAAVPPVPGIPAANAGGHLVIGPLAVMIDNHWLAYLTPLFYGAPSPGALARWQTVLSGAGLQSRVVIQPGRGVHLMILVAERGSEP